LKKWEIVPATANKKIQTTSAKSLLSKKKVIVLSRMLLTSTNSAKSSKSSTDLVSLRKIANLAKAVKAS